MSKVISPRRKLTEGDDSWIEPAIVLCDCGLDVECTDEVYGSDCACGRFYGITGVPYSPRDQWEESFSED